MSKTMERMIALGTAVLLVVALVPVTALAADPNHGATKAGGVQAQANVPPDSYEPDDSTATAKPMAPVNRRTWHPMADSRLNDMDFFYFNVAATGTPVLLETIVPVDKPVFSDAMIKVYDEEGALEMVTPVAGQYFNPWGFDGNVASNDDHLWVTESAGLVFVAPHPGKYYARVFSDDFGLGQWGDYTLFGYAGIGRRIWGQTRFETATEISKLFWGDTSNFEGRFPRQKATGIVIANGRSFGDAMTAGILAAFTGSPLLLTDGPDRIAPSQRAELERLAMTAYYRSIWIYGPRDPEMTPYGKTPLYVVGGPAAVSNSLVRSVSASQYLGDIIRVYGRNRYATAAAVMEKLEALRLSGSEGPFGPSGVRMAFIASGESPSDVVAAAPVASAFEAPLLLTRKGDLPGETRAMLTKLGVGAVVLVGGTGAVSDAVQADLAAYLGGADRVRRIAGANRYQTCKLLVDMQGEGGMMNRRRMIVVSGEGLPDAMTAVPLSMAMDYAPVLFTRPGTLSDEVKAYIDANKPFTQVSYMLGGTAAIQPGVYNLWNSYGQPFPVPEFQDSSD